MSRPHAPLPNPAPAAAAGTSSYIFVFLEIFSCEGGIQSYVQDVLAAYTQQPTVFPAQVFLLRDRPGCPNPIRHPHLHFHYCGSRWMPLSRLRFLGQLAWTLFHQRPQRVICGHVLLASWVGRLCRWFGLPYTVMTYGKEVWHPLPPQQRRALQQAHSLWTISRYSRDQASAANQLDPHRIHLVPCVVDGTSFAPGPQSPALVDRYDLAGAKVLMTVARLWSGDIYKGVDVTIRALPTILSQHPQVKYLVVGRGDDQPRLAHLAQELGVAAQVIFAGYVPTHQLVEHYRLADAYVMPSQEGFGIVYLEALTCGLPVLSGDADGSADPLQDGRMGWRVPHRDPQAVAQACLAMLAGTDPRCNGPWLRQETLQHFSNQALSNTLSRLLAPSPHP